MPDPILDDIKSYFLEGSIPSTTIIQEILAEKSPKLHEALSTNISLDGELRKEAICETICLLYKIDIEKGRSISKKLDLSPDDFLDLAKIAFDISANEKKPQKQYQLITNFILDNKRTSTGILLYMGELISNSKFGEASELKNKYKDSIRKPDQEKIGTELFEQSLTFSPIDERRDYQPAKYISEIFELDKAYVQKHANTQFEYNINHGMPEEALKLGQLFKIPSSKLYNATFSIFNDRFEKFSQALDSGKYRGELKLEEDDPYRQAVQIVENHHLLVTSSSGNKEKEKIAHEIQKRAFLLIKRLNSYVEGVEIEPAIKTFFTGSIISDFKLMTMNDPAYREDCIKIAQSILDELEEEIDSIDRAVSSYSILFMLYQQIPAFRDSIRGIATRMFEIFLDNNRKTMIDQTFGDFELKPKDILPALKKKALEALEADKFETIKELDSSFSIVKKLRSDEDFLAKAFYMFEHRIHAGEYNEAMALHNLLNFPSKRIATPVRLAIRGFLRKEQNDEALRIMKLFHVKKSHLMSILIESYAQELEKGVAQGAAFRQQFGLSVGDVGFMHWLFKEVFHF